MNSSIKAICAALATFVVGAALLVPALSHAQTRQVVSGDETTAIMADNAKKSEIIDSICIDLNRIYVFPEVAAQMEKKVRGNLKKGDYDSITTVAGFTIALTEDFREISHDRHLGVQFMSPAEVADVQNASVSDDEMQRQQERRLAEMKRNNFGWQELRLLPGNIGYVRLDGFNDAALGGATAVAAMNFLSNSDAIIFDLRRNGGGSPSMIQLIISYLLKEPTHLNSFYVRESDSIEQFWTSAFVDGPRLTDVDVYVLTSGFTFSAAEEFTYNLKNLKRATIIGETTGGGAHPVSGFSYPNLNVSVRIPYGRAINPISGTNWEGTGVTPDIEVPSAQALDRAHQEAMKKLREKTADPGQQAGLDWAIAGLEAVLNPVTLDPESLADFAGAYEDRVISFENGALYYQRGDRPKMQMLPMSATMFRFDATDYFRLEVVTDRSGRPVRLIGRYDDGSSDESLRTDTDTR
jgi:hypothetical protein